MSAPATPFVPSPRQRCFRDFVEANPAHRYIRDLCSAAGLPRTTFYRWCRDPGFRQWFACAWSTRCVLDGMFLVNFARTRAPLAFPFWKALFDLTFDPKGVRMLQHWQQALASVSPDGFAASQEKSVPPVPRPDQSLSSHCRSKTASTRRAGEAPSSPPNSLPGRETSLPGIPDPQLPDQDNGLRWPLPTPAQHLRLLRNAMRAAGAAGLRVARYRRSATRGNMGTL
ncbi:MAG: hypothetical protein ACRD1C_11440 [Terriglobales bacterium]